MSLTIYHNPQCSKSRETLALIRATGVEPTVVEYLKTPYTHDQLSGLLQDLAMSARALIRTGGAVYKTMGLDDLSLDDEQLIDAMVREPALVNRPIVVSPLGTRLCRPPELVREILPAG